MEPREVKVGWKFSIKKKEKNCMTLTYLFKEFGIGCSGPLDEVWTVQFKKGSPQNLVGRTFRLYIRYMENTKYFLNEVLQLCSK